MKDPVSDIRETLRPEGVHFAFCSADEPIPPPPAEELSIYHDAAEKRRRDFLLGRHCARLALSQAGAEPGPIHAGEDGSPLWPRRICGSISHTDGAACAVVGSTDRFLSLGIDIERKSREISAGALDIIVNPAERKWLSKAAGREKELAILIFCAKESVFKLFSPVFKIRFGFPAVSLMAEPKDGTFSYILEKDLHPDLPAGKTFTGRYFFNDEWIIALASLPSA